MRCCCPASDASQLAAPRVPRAFSLLAWRVRIRLAVSQRCFLRVSRFTAPADMHAPAMLLSSQLLVRNYSLEPAALLSLPLLL